ncbi:YcxB family protein [[Clostridium] scindens]|uniref:YcxB family protein n=1 Tax=Clostridium scindens (strain JCM 10418 / VPI 12708) TaxID=29347 RepID=UPI002676D502|nr:YcxB family protein [[Clostridium] scindens]
MEQKLTVTMTGEALFDFLLYHTYSKFSGFLTNVLGTAVAIMGVILLIMGKITPVHLIFYIAAATIFLAYTPFLLKYRAKRQMEVNKDYQTVWEYKFYEKGISVSYADKTKEYPWEQIERTVATPKTIGIYYGKDHVFIIPKQDFGQKFVPVMKMIAEHIGLHNVRLR